MNERPPPPPPPPPPDAADAAKDDPVTGDPADGVRHRLDPAFVTVERIAGRIRLSVFATIAAVALLVGWSSGGIAPWLLVASGSGWIVLVPAGWILVLRWPAWEYRIAGYRLTRDDLEIWSGVLWRRAIRVPLSRVQYTDVQQGPLQRRHGIATLEVHTAGTESAKVDLPGLRRERALRIRDALIEHGGDDAV